MRRCSLDDIEVRRRDAVFLDGLGVASLPDPTTAGDFCRRFDEASVMALQEAFNRARLRVWQRQPASFVKSWAVIDADATIVPTDGETKQGMDIAYNGIWGYSALVVSLANTNEPLFLKPHGANRPSHEGVVELYDSAIALCRQAGFTEVLLRGDTDFVCSPAENGHPFRMIPDPQFGSKRTVIPEDSGRESALELQRV